jgi:HEPN domain-containing protein
MEIKRQIEYWISSADEDFSSAKILLQNERVLHSLFLWYLTIEKAIKAHVVKHSMSVAPKIHNLSYLIEKTDLELDDEQLLLCDTLMFYQLEGRYPAFFPKPPE